MKGTSVKVAILSFFFQLAKKPHHTKSQLSLRPLLPSPNDLRNICKFCFLIICRNVLGQKSGSKPSQRLLHFEKYISFSLKNRTLLLNIFGLKNALIKCIGEFWSELASKNAKSMFLVSWMNI